MRNWGPGHPNWSMPGQREVGMFDAIRETLRLGAPPATVLAGDLCPGCRMVHPTTSSACRPSAVLLVTRDGHGIEVAASASWLTSDSPQNHAEDRKCRSCKGTGRMLDDRPFTNDTRIGPAPTCWSCGGTRWAR